MKNKNKIKGAEAEVSESSSAVGSFKNTTEEVMVVSSERKWNGGRGS